MSLKEKLLKLKEKVLNGAVDTNDIKDEQQEILLTNKLVNNKTLEEATPEFFPTTGHWVSSCFRKDKDLLIGNLPCHLRDNKWLASMFQKDQELYHYTIDEILDFVKKSKLFQEKRHEYELEIVKWQIDFIANHGEGWLCDEKYGGDVVYLTPVCDLGVRKGVVDTLVAIGMDREVIEEGIEKNAHMWRNSFIESAFRNQFEPTFYLINGNKGHVLEPIDPEHKEKWIKMRKYEYYCDHKRSVDKYGVVEPEMNISQEELKELTQYLAIKNAERLEQIEQYKEKIDKEIKKVETDFNFSKEDIVNFIEETVVCDDYEHQKIWFVFCQGFEVLDWALAHQQEKTPEEIYSEIFDTDDLKKQYNLEEKANANNIKTTSLDELINKIVESPRDFYVEICNALTPEERLFIIRILENKKCFNCTNPSCRVEYKEKVGLDDDGQPQGSKCIFWRNEELIGKSKVLRLTDINKLK